VRGVGREKVRRAPCFRLGLTGCEAQHRPATGAEENDVKRKRADALSRGRSSVEGVVGTCRELRMCKSQEEGHPRERKAISP